MRMLNGYKIEPPNEKEKYYYLKKLIERAEKGHYGAIIELREKWGIEGNHPNGYGSDDEIVRGN